MGAKKIVSFPFQETVQNNSENIKDLKTQIQNCNENIYKLEIRLSQKIEKNSQNIITRLENTIKEGKTQLEQRIDDKYQHINQRISDHRQDQKFWLKIAVPVGVLIFSGIFYFMFFLNTKNEDLIKNNKQLIISFKESSDKLIRENKERLIRIEQQLNRKTEAKNIKDLEGIGNTYKSHQPLLKKKKNQSKQKKFN